MYTIYKSYSNIQRQKIRFKGGTNEGWSHIYIHTFIRWKGGGYIWLINIDKKKGGGAWFNNKIHTGYDQKEPITYQIHPSHEAVAHVSAAQSLKTENPPVAPLKLHLQQTGHKGLISELERALKMPTGGFDWKYHV